MRFVIIALFIVLACQAQAQEGQTDTQGQARAEQDRPADPLSPIRIEIIESKAEADARKRREEEASRNDIDDLRAQQGMNEATQRMATYSWWQTLAVIAGTLLLVWTLILTIGANRAATAAAVASTTANEILQRTSVAELRPYVVIDDIETELENAGAKVGQQARVFFRWRNCGQTPTRNLKWGCGYRLVIDTEPFPGDFDFSPGLVRSSIIGPGQTTRDVSVVVSSADFERAKIGGSHEVVVWCFVEYSDGFPNTPRRRSEVCVQLDYVGDEAVFRPNTVSRYNGADDDCLKKPMTSA